MAQFCEQIGGQLRASRTAAGLTVADVAFRTQIPRSVLESLEAEDFSVFSSPVYAKSFLAQYSEFLNVDAQPWLDALEPGGFTPGGYFGAVLESPIADAAEHPHAPEHRGGVVSVLGLLAVTSALVFGAIQGYEFFETRFGAESDRAPREAAVSPPPRTPEKTPEMISVTQNEADDFANPPPRAIIVR